MNPIVLTLAWERGKKTWCACITGRSRRYGLERHFAAAVERRPDTVSYWLEPGLYEVCELGERRFIRVQGGEAVALSRDEALALLVAAEEADRKAAGEVDGIIARFTSEGGIAQPGDN